MPWHLKIFIAKIQQYIKFHFLGNKNITKPAASPTAILKVQQSEIPGGGGGGGLTLYMLDNLLTFLFSVDFYQN